MSEELGAPVPAEPKLCCMGGHPAGCQCNSAPPEGDFKDVTVIATNREQMAAAQAVLVARAEARLVVINAEMDELQENLEKAIKYKLRQTGIIGRLNKLKKRLDFYTKLRAAFEAGFVLIPDMDVEVFAVRTTRREPTKQYRKEKSTYSQPTPWLNNVETNRPPLGAGENVSVRPQVREGTHTERNEKQELVYVTERFTDGFLDEIDFPFALAKPQIVDLTTRAMALKVFDDFGVLPASRRGDPMVIGRIILKEGWRTKRMNFLVCWFVDTREI